MADAGPAPGGQHAGLAGGLANSAQPESRGRPPARRPASRWPRRTGSPGRGRADGRRRRRRRAPRRGPGGDRQAVAESKPAAAEKAEPAAVRSTCRRGWTPAPRRRRTARPTASRRERVARRRAISSTPDLGPRRQRQDAGPAVPAASMQVAGGLRRARGRPPAGGGLDAVREAQERPAPTRTPPAPPTAATAPLAPAGDRLAESSKPAEMAVFTGCQRANVGLRPVRAR